MRCDVDDVDDPIQMECQALKNIASALAGKGLINQVAEQKK
jgi:hypothetical protein